MAGMTLQFADQCVAARPFDRLGVGVRRAASKGGNVVQAQWRQACDRFGGAGRCGKQRAAVMASIRINMDALVDATLVGPRRLQARPGWQSTEPWN